ncbi:MAG: hypothetical protein DRZ82_01395 [Thermoprotei archaeon]|nr:MAG: hypothetical protein DRZ82_01395 [Thermoprotei archaeon]
MQQSLCLLCRGSKLLCGMAYCPIIVRHIAKLRVRNIPDKNIIYGSSPPSLFIGRIGYPIVHIGPGAPPYTGDTSIYDHPESWINKPLEEILDYRFSIITGRTAVKIKDIDNKLVLILQELAMAERPVDIEMVLKKRPIPRVILDEYVPPQGPSAPLMRVSLGGNVKVNRKMEQVYYDTDLRTYDAVMTLYRSGVSVSQIQKLLSVGGIGTLRRRRLVPTRWSITAIDSMISEGLLKEVRRFPLLNEYLVFVRKYMKNLFVAILAPRPWSYEWMECWFPQSTWNPTGSKPIIEGDYEGFKGRTEYPDIGGCYYASRLATLEYLMRIRRQATAILLREIYPGFNLPIGVWFVRENIRELFKRRPMVFHDIREVFMFLKKITRVDFNVWVEKSVLLRRLMREDRILKWC